MQREVVKISELKAAPYNPRQISGEALAGLSKSLERWGVVQEVVANKRTGYIVGGHQRVAALKKMGVKDVPVVWVDLDDVEEKALNVALNNPHISGQFDDTIAGLLAEIRDGIGPDDFEALMLDDLLPPDATVVEGNTDPDDVPEVPEEPITKPGDLWILGDHRLLCGDSTNVQHVERLMGGEKADLCFTSPPYNSKDGGYKTDYSGKTKKFYIRNCDNRTEDEWVQFCDDVLCIIGSILRSDDSPVVWNVMYTANCRSGYGRSLFCGKHGLSVKETICWDKGAGFPSASRGILSRNWELIFVLSKGPKYQTTQGENEPRWAKWDIPRPKQHEHHKATFPTQLAIRAIKDFSGGLNVYEPFCGSGTTLIASEQMDRKCFAMELDPAYCDVIVKRWEDFTGKKAKLEEANDATG